MQTMYDGTVNSPSTELAQAITQTQTSIEVTDVSVLPDAPNQATIGMLEDAETILYTSVSGNVLTVQRGFQGTAKAWEAGTLISRRFTEYDYRMLKENIEEAFKSPRNLGETDAATGERTGLLTLLASGWIASGDEYRYVVTDSDVTAKTRILISLPGPGDITDDSANAALYVAAQLSRGNSSTGQYTIIAGALPTEDIIVYVTAEEVY